ncbi:hypothetical protein Tco_1096670 [Tanacetum coccineum]
MNQAITQQVALDNALVSPEDRNAFLISADVPEIYMQQFWFTISKIKDSSLYQFKLDNKKFKIGVELFCEILQICLKVPNIICINHRETLLPLSTNVYLGKVQTFSTKLTTDRQVSGDVKARPFPDSLRSSSLTSSQNTNSFPEETTYVMVNDNIKKSKAYQTYLAFSTRAVIPKKARYGTKAPATPKKDTLNVSKKKTLDQSKKLKGMEILLDAAQLAADTQKAIKASKKVQRLQQQTRGSSEGAGITPEVPNEPKGKSRGTSKGDGITPEVPDVSKAKYAVQELDEDD